MFANIDRILFPNECLVLEIKPGTRYIYPIFKNGSSSLLAEKRFRVLTLDEINKLEVIEVFVRNPHERFLSGVQTYLDKSPAWADHRTLMYMIARYLYINRHFCPQIFWLLNLSRFTRARFHIKPIHELPQVVPADLNKTNLRPEIREYFQDQSHVKFFNEMDEVLTINLIQQICGLDEIMQTLRSHYGDLYQDAFVTTKTIVDVLP